MQNLKESQPPSNIRNKQENKSVKGLIGHMEHFDLNKTD